MAFLFRRKAYHYFIAYRGGDDEGMRFGRMQAFLRKPINEESVKYLEELIKKDNHFEWTVVTGIFYYGRVFYDFDNGRP